MLTIPGYNQHETGASLIVALIFLLVLTIAGITAMRFATMEERMASNTQFRTDAYQLTQSEIRAQMKDFSGSVAKRVPLLNAKNASAHGLTQERLLELALPKSSREPVNLTTVISDIRGSFAANSVRYLSDSPCEGGYSLEKFSCTYYEINTKAVLDGGASSDQVQGIVFRTNK
ncbi:pilus assembly PilX family protein [Metapseudomonas otitidis]|uniref:pilus assembly PilX family protein n=1 Tax=Metapseudomonas otitidis TaxID=319939 RepID=UPI00244B8D3A|nr:PilX N-terminal domain-containing pilus assembly protein [Pseudomonas otitidis]MDH0336613.1 PilX N-terminal domain-containing pilus assembly protein [Pseudomonas otitidis]